MPGATTSDEHDELPIRTPDADADLPSPSRPALADFDSSAEAAEPSSLASLDFVCAAPLPCSFASTLLLAAPSSAFTTSTSSATLLFALPAASFAAFLLLREPSSALGRLARV